MIFNDIRDIIRRLISDPKTKEVVVMKEYLADGNGSASQTFETDNLPIVSDSDTQFFAGRRLYAQTASTAATGWVYNFDETKGIYSIPVNASTPSDTEKCYGSYIYKEWQEYIYSDDEIAEYLKDGVSMFNTSCEVSYGISGTTITPEPSDEIGTLMALCGIYLVKKQMEEEGLESAITIRVGGISVASRGRERTLSLREFRTDLNEMLKIYKMKGIVGDRLDNYSTKHLYNLHIGRDT